ncbi:tRNA (uridine(34)/cytosine(34)/5-carboxymethylaminomethyluridine(34)-2'-O)-methyltransferase TrmL [Facklamia sp. DSM 111018]|uniref:Putative tRNA (cytidine(34)-2'-O)-methyltransferase n=1 Tax=Facklamia lactis TaxID=2749967 RepID=A0ABS0LPA4_9LACT|nr:tRNA (uridine(34)/cytosine(34)/5-carboxymethylaminomethyluridine(34)-2'-O)-methyltransferase TrmL [Facklamia lactis]MBG9980189.1 tRNA (uridine(34)/cytosine(34)/5-carboxymethylaminomethyluridine(34)-2'-O)-methyltransferase TrmL [Facklamia lactis]MBG9985991.1 tRNA (uridine(34)/cytosine(34)/5-carboxymethylaminomethyluridine(34)-2'-O)-methyltransferase TrmL [Facklamia lactis]
MKNHIVLFEPLMPANTGNISRSCAATNSPLHLIEPLGFSTDDKMLKRAGLDYWHHVDITYHKSLKAFMSYLGNRRLFLITKFAPQIYSEVNLSDPKVEEQFFIFGKETTGLPVDFMEEHREQCLRIPMNDQHVRSLNLSNTANIIIYEALRQQAFNGLDTIHHYRDTQKAKDLNW